MSVIIPPDSVSEPHLPADGAHPKQVEGYLQIALSEGGRIAVQGSPDLVEWLLARLAADGWRLEFDNIRWCG